MEHLLRYMRNAARHAAPCCAGLLILGGCVFLCPHVAAQEPAPPPPATVTDASSVPEAPAPPAAPAAVAPEGPQGPPPAELPKAPPAPDGPGPDCNVADVPGGPGADSGFRGPNDQGCPMAGRESDRPVGPPPQDAAMPNAPRGAQACGGQDPQGLAGRRGGPADRRPGEGMRGRGPMDPVQLFKDIDANADGAITLNEFADFHGRMRPHAGPGQYRHETPNAFGRPADREGPPSFDGPGNRQGPPAFDRSGDRQGPPSFDGPGNRQGPPPFDRSGDRQGPPSFDRPGDRQGPVPSADGPRGPRQGNDGRGPAMKGGDMRGRGQGNDVRCPCPKCGGMHGQGPVPPRPESPNEGRDELKDRPVDGPR